MKPRRRKGATLGLIAVSVLVIVVLGIGCFFLAKIMGGGREVVNATDAGALAVAKKGLRSNHAAVAMPTDPNGNADFGPLQDPKLAGQMTLYTYNRAVAQTLLVAMNAQQESTFPAMTNFNIVWGELTTLGNQLTSKLNAESSLQPDFTTVANSNSTKMYGVSAVNEDPSYYKTALLKPAGSTNVYFDTNSFPAGIAPASLNLVNAAAPDMYTKTPGAPSVPAGVSPYQGKYMAGYQAIGPVMSQIFIGVPNFPQQKPHLISNTDFSNAAENFTLPGGTFAPPNAFRVASQSQDQKSGSMGGAVACAIVGVVQDSTSTDPVDYVASLPGGYIQISNRAGIQSGNLPGGWTMPVPDPNNIFNNELGGTGPQVYAYSPSGGGNDVFSTNQSALQAWAAYNATAGPPAPANPDQYGRDATQYPNGPPSTTGIYVAQGNGSHAAAISDMLGLLPADFNENSYGNCYDELMATASLSGACGDINAFDSAYGRDTGNSGGALPPGVQWSAVDALKLEVINEFQGDGLGGTHSGITVSGTNPGGATLPPPPAGSITPGTGFGVYPTGDMGWPTMAPVPLEDPSGTAMGMLTQVQNEGGACVTTVLTDIAQRCKEISPSFGGNNAPSSAACTTAVSNLLSSQPLPMGKTLYIHMVDPMQPGVGGINGLMYGPAGWTNSTLVSAATPDGPPGGGPGACASTAYDLSTGSPSSLIDSFSPNGHNDGDNDLHEAPYRTFTGDLTAQDHADFILSSGYQNLLGKMDFYQTTTGSESFSRPN